MSSLIFQPLLHDPLGWKPGATTYAEHFQWRRVRVNRKDKIISPYGQKYLRKQRDEQLKRSNSEVQRSTEFEENFLQKRIASPKKSEQNLNVERAESTRPPSSKSAPAVLEQRAPTRQKRSATLNRESNNASRISQRSTSHSVANEEASRLSPVHEQYRSLPDEEIVIFLAPPVEETRHWIAFPNPRTPQHIIDTKLRLGQIKAPALVARSKSALYSSTEATSVTPTTIERNELTKFVNSQKQKSAEQRHFLDFNLPQTPDDLRAARHRIEKHRYNPSLDNYPPRASTTFTSWNEETSKPVTVNQTETESLPAATTTTVTDNQQTTNEQDQNDEQQNQTENPVVPIDADHLPKTYVEALETANVAEERYLKESKERSEKPTEVIVYRLPSRTQEQRSSSSKSLRLPTPSTSNANSSLREQDFNRWVRQATDQERTTAMKILTDVLQQPTNADEQAASGQRSTPASRSRSGMRKLGIVRTQPRVPADQNNVWNIPKPIFDRNDTMTSFHHVPTSKSAFVQI